MQKRVVKFMNRHQGLLVVHGTGTGKTLTAVTASQCYLDKHPRGHVVFIGPASLTSNFKKELNKYGEEDHSKYDFYSFDTFYNAEKNRRGSVDLSNALLIIDEAHNLRNPTGKKSEKIVEATFRARKRLLLTATPFVNNMMDFIPLINMVYGRRMVGTYKEYQRGEVTEWLGKKVDAQNIATFRYLLKDIVDVEIGRQDMAEFPQKIEHVKDVPMTNEYYRRYVRIIQGENLYGIVFSKPHVFYNGYRRAVNKAGPEYYSTKVEEALPIISRGKSIIYTNWIEFGVKPIERALKQEDVSYRTFTGETRVSERQEIVDGFNNDEFDALILTKAGGEGLDLKGVKSVIVMDPTWNDSGLQQIIGRAIRYKSHAHLSESQRKVDIYYMVLTGPRGEKTDAGYPLGDVLLYDIIKKKNEINATLTAIMQEL
jgi:SNF2 family DNA or RNA helicase